MTTANTPARKPARKRATDPEFATRFVNPDCPESKHDKPL